MRRIFLYILIGLIALVVVFAIRIGYTIWRLPAIESYRTFTPKITAMMKHNHDADRAGIIYVPIEKISPSLIRAVLLAEDVSFFSHHGIDWDEFRLSLRQNWERKRLYRGGSTITMQLARNLFLSPSRNPLRKIEEMIIATMMEKKLSKRRILELYLNVVEWGPHVYGAEAAARYHFGTSAANLTVEQACALAAILPSPKKWNPNKPGKGLQERISKLCEKYDTFPLKVPENLQ